MKIIVEAVLREDHGGYAGIRVPWIDSNNNGIRDEREQAELNLYGEGTLVAIGGDAGQGGSAISTDAGGAGRRWCSVQESEETGGKGGNSNTMPSIAVDVKKIERSGKDGESGENCGKIMIHNSLTVYAYGGAGGSGGIYTAETGSSGTGGGGYPGAGIGRWSVLGEVVLTTVMVAEAIVVGLTRCRLKEINL